MREITLIAGPCTIESKESFYNLSLELKRIGVTCLRGGAYKPRTSPKSFQGLGEEGIYILKEVSERLKIKTISEIMDAEDIPLFNECIDIIQVGSRNMQNFSLLKKLSKLANKTILLKRSCSGTYKELLQSAEYLEGLDVILCERGIRTFETHTRNTLDLAAVPVLKSLSNYNVYVDPSHGTGLRELVSPMSLGALAVGADGLIIEVHDNPDEAVCDGRQSLNLDQFKNLAHDIRKTYRVIEDLSVSN